MEFAQPDLIASLLFAAGIGATIKSTLLALLGVLNAILAIIATIAVWKSYLVVGTKIALIFMILVPVFGIIAYFIWGQKKVSNA